MSLCQATIELQQEYCSSTMKNDITDALDRSVDSAVPLSCFLLALPIDILQGLLLDRR